MALLVIILYGFVIWMNIRASHQTLGFIEGTVEQYMVEKAKYFVAMFRESYESPALTYSIMKVINDLASHGGITSKFIEEHGILQSNDNYYVSDVEVDVNDNKLECMKVEKETYRTGLLSTEDRYVLYWTQAEGIGIEKFRPYAYFSDENTPIGSEDHTISFETDNNRPVGEVAITLYFLKNGYVEIRSGDNLIKRVETTGVYVIDGEDINNNKLVLRGSSEDVAVLRGVVATIYRDKRSVGKVATCARDMLEDLMWNYISPVKRTESYYGMEVNNTYPNVSFDPSTYYIHGSSWMPKGANITKYFGNGRVMVMVHSNMFAESNVSVRYGLLLKYASWFVENIEGVLLARIWKILDGYEDTCAMSEVNGCPNADNPTCQYRPDCTVVPSGENVKSDIISLLEDIERDLSSKSSINGIEWSFELVDKDGDFENNFEDVVYEFIDVYRGNKCTVSSCNTANSGFENYCYHYYYHRYIVHDMVIKVTITDNRYKIYDEEKKEWLPVKLVFYIEVSVDDNNCREGSNSYVCSKICGTDGICKDTYATSYSDTNTPYGSIIDLTSVELPK